MPPGASRSPLRAGVSPLGASRGTLRAPRSTLRAGPTKHPSVSAQMAAKHDRVDDLPGAETPHVPAPQHRPHVAGPAASGWSMRGQPMPSGKVLVCQYDSERITVIEKLTLQNFKVLRDVEVGLRPLTVIVGPNASGKSSILQALFLITASFTKSESTLAQIFREESAIELFRSRSSKGPTALGFSARSDGREFSPEIVLDQDIPVATIPPIGDGRTRTGHVKAGAIELFARPAVVLKLDVVKLASPSYPKTTSLVLPKDGDGLSSVIAGLYLEDASRFRSLVERLRSVVAGVKDLHVRRAPAGGQIGYELVFDMQGAEGIPARAVSDGTLLTLGLLTVLAVPHPPQLLLIDDLERGLHPRALGDLVQQLRRVQEQNPELPDRRDQPLAVPARLRRGGRGSPDEP